MTASPALPELFTLAEFLAGPVLVLGVITAAAAWREHRAKTTTDHTSDPEESTP